MICVNELFIEMQQERDILNSLSSFAPFAPHVCEELWETLGNTDFRMRCQWPAFNEEYLKEDTVNYTYLFQRKSTFQHGISPLMLITIPFRQQLWQINKPRNGLKAKPVCQKQ